MARPWYKWYVQDYWMDTDGLTDGADLLYRRLLDQCWMKQGLPVDKFKLQRLCRYNARKMSRYWREIEFKFVEIDGKLWHPKMHELMTQLVDKQEKAKSSARCRWDANAYANAMRTVPYATRATDKEPDKDKDKKTRSSGDEHLKYFEDFWRIQIRKCGKKKCLQTWKSRKLDKIAKKIIDAYKIQALEIFTHRNQDKIPLPLTWLNGDRWEDEVISEKPKSRPNGGNGSWPGQAPARVQPPQASDLPKTHARVLTPTEKANFKDLVARAKAKIKPSKPIEAAQDDPIKEPDRQPTMAQLLVAAKSCFAAYEEVGKPCDTEWRTPETNEQSKCHWCAKFEIHRVAGALQEKFFYNPKRQDHKLSERRKPGGKKI